MKLIGILLLILFNLLFSTLTAPAHDCRAVGTPSEELKRATAVFSGKVTDIFRVPITDSTSPHFGGMQEVAKIEVDKWWKGGGKEIILPMGRIYFSGFSARWSESFTFQKA